MGYADFTSKDFSRADGVPMTPVGHERGARSRHGRGMLMGHELTVLSDYQQ